MTYVLILFVWSNGATSTAEFNSLQSCQYAIEQLQGKLMIGGICVPK
jgi:hypothetical protein